jgi:hypothetical protein
MNCSHQSAYWTADSRCTRPWCGHRMITCAGDRPLETREFLRSPWTWPLIPFEIASRIEARWRGVLARKGRYPHERGPQAPAQLDYPA